MLYIIVIDCQSLYVNRDPNSLEVVYSLHIIYEGRSNQSRVFDIHIWIRERLEMANGINLFLLLSSENSVLLVKILDS